MFLGKKTEGSEGLGPSMGPEAYRTYLWYRTAEVGLELNEGKWFDDHVTRFLAS